MKWRAWVSESKLASFEVRFPDAPTPPLELAMANAHKWASKAHATEDGARALCGVYIPDESVVALWDDVGAGRCLTCARILGGVTGLLGRLGSRLRRQSRRVPRHPRPEKGKTMTKRELAARPRRTQCSI